MSARLDWPVARLFEAIRRPKGRRWLNVVPGDGALRRAVDDRFRNLTWTSPRDVGEWEFTHEGNFDVAISAPYISDRTDPRNIKPIPGWPGYFANADGQIFTGKKRGNQPAEGLMPMAAEGGHLRLYKRGRAISVSCSTAELAAITHPIGPPRGLATEVDHAIQVSLRLAPHVLMLLPVAWLAARHRTGWLSETMPARIFVLPDELLGEACAWMQWTRGENRTRVFKLLEPTPEWRRKWP
jgi:hypothetical protein